MPSRLEFIEQYRENSKRYFKYIKYPNIPLSINDIYAITVEDDRDSVCVLLNVQRHYLYQ